MYTGMFYSTAKRGNSSEPKFSFCFSQTVNIENAYDDDRFDPSVDEGQSFKHRSILGMAIKNSLGNIIGVIQLVNKFDNLVCSTVTLSGCLKYFIQCVFFVTIRISRETMKILWKLLRSFVAWEFTIPICMKKQLLRWPNRVLHWKYLVIMRQHRWTMLDGYG